MERSKCREQGPANREKGTRKGNQKRRERQFRGWNAGGLRKIGMI
jgi:hypothetical protein